MIKDGRERRNEEGKEKRNNSGKGRKIRHYMG